MHAPRRLLVSLALLAACASPASASFHLMQIEQAIGGVDGDVTKQAVQLRQRGFGQNLVQFSRLRVFDAAGANPVLLVDLTASVSNPAAGTRILAATAAFGPSTTPPITPDVVMSPIPETYLAAGSLTFEDDGGSVLWRLSWGGAAYTGPGTGTLDNDADANYNPPFDGGLPSAAAQALRYKFAFGAGSTDNANDYELTSGSVSFINNAGATGSIGGSLNTNPPPGGALALGAPFPNPARHGFQFMVTLPREAPVRVALFDLSGRQVRELANRTLPAGPTALTWHEHASPLAAGLYVLELSVGGEHRARKVLFLP